MEKKTYFLLAFVMKSEYTWTEFMKNQNILASVFQVFFIYLFSSKSTI